MKVGDTVKYAKPETGEEGFRFILKEHNGDRVAIELITNDRIKPVEVVATEEIEIAEEFAAGTTISAEIRNSAKARGLDWIGTGGGFDFIQRTLATNDHAPILVMRAVDDCGSPEKLDEEASVTLHLTSEWTGREIVFYFTTAAEAMDWMAGFSDVNLNNLWQ